jgi:hypothetical protein
MMNGKGIELMGLAVADIDNGRTSAGLKIRRLQLLTG